MAGKARAAAARSAAVTNSASVKPPLIAAGAASAIVSNDAAGFLRRYIFSSDHKILGLQYFFLALAAALMGIFLSLLMRIHIIWPTVKIFGIGIAPESYLALVTMHATFMVFFVLTLAPQNAFGNYFLPLQIGAQRMAFPGLNMASFWLAFVSFLIIVTEFFCPGCVPIPRRTRYHPPA